MKNPPKATIVSLLLMVGLLMATGAAWGATGSDSTSWEPHAISVIIILFTSLAGFLTGVFAPNDRLSVPSRFFSLIIGIIMSFILVEFASPHIHYEWVNMRVMAILAGIFGGLGVVLSHEIVEKGSSH